MTAFRFMVAVPIEPVLHESIDSSITSHLPVGRFGHFDVAREGPGYVLRLECVSSSPTEAMRQGIGSVEDLLRVLAAGNDAFRARAAGIIAENLGETDSPPDAVQPQTGSVYAADRGFFQEHSRLDKLKESLEAEAKAVEGRDRWPEYLDDALELNYLAVTSVRPVTRWLLESIALERLAVGRLGPRSILVTSRLQPEKRQILRERLAAAFDGAGFAEPEVTRLVERALATEDKSAPSHIAGYLAKIGVEVDPREPSVWWARRGSLAHGSTEPVDASVLSRLVSRTQLALSHELGDSEA